jgi:threonyl-tRNA synthetase
MPAWLAPVQAVVLNITDRQDTFCEEIAESLENKGFRVQLDLRNEKIGYKIREHTLQRVPFLLIVGDREVAEGAVAVRTREGQDLGSMPVSDFAKHLQGQIARRGTLED